MEIRNEFIKPYYIIKEKSGYTIAQVVVPTAEYSNSGKSYLRHYFHNPDLEKIIDRLIFLLIEKKNYLSIKEYLGEKLRLKNKLKEINYD